MKIPLDDVQVGDVLVLCNGERGTVINVRHVQGILTAHLNWSGQVNENENDQEVSDIIKWVGRGKWKLIRRV
jgi:hypothetical protein